MGRKNNRDRTESSFNEFSKLSNFNRGFNQAPKELHKATCADCGKDCDVPFKPKGDRPVYCRDCFNKHKRG